MNLAKAGLSPEQGPPLAIPLSFFLTAPLALCTAGILLLSTGGDGMDSVWGGANIAVVHLGVVGFLMFVMLGALYQMLPVVAGAVLPGIRLAHLVHAMLVIGAVSLVAAQATGEPRLFASAVVTLAGALLLFLIPAGAALLRSRVEGPTAWGMRLALVSLAVVVTGGLWMSSARAGLPFHGEWVTLRWAHAHVGFIGWLGCLTAAVSWQVLPMFFLAPAPPSLLPWAVLGGVAITVAVLIAVTLAGLSPTWVALACLPGALAVWVLEPGWAIWALEHRKRKRRDPGLWFWRLSMGCALACPWFGAAAVMVDSAALPLLYGLFVLWGFAAALVHGMLTRIVPFLVWFHLCAPRLGTEDVPSMRDLMPDALVGRGFRLHAATLVAGIAAALFARNLAWRVFGAGLFATGAHLEVMLYRAWRTGRGNA